MTQPTDFNTPWSLHFDRDGTEDIAVIRDAGGDDLVTSRHFWLPEGDDPVPPTLAAVRLMHAAPKLLAALQQVLTFAANRNVPPEAALNAVAIIAERTLTEVDERAA